MALKNIAFQKFNVNKNQRLLTSQQTFNGYISPLKVWIKMKFLRFSLNGEILYFLDKPINLFWPNNLI